MKLNKLNEQLLELKKTLKEKLSTNHQLLLPILQKLGLEKMDNAESNEQLLELKTTLKEKRENVETLTKQIQDIENAIELIKINEKNNVSKNDQKIFKKIKENPLIKIIESTFDCQYSIHLKYLNCFIPYKSLNLTYKIPIHTIKPHEDPTWLIINYLLKPFIQTFIKKTFIFKNLNQFELIKRNDFDIKVNNIDFDPNTVDENNISLRLEISTHNKKFNTITIKDDALYTQIYMDSYMENEYALETMKTNLHADIPGTIKITENLFNDIETFLLENENELVKIINRVERIVDL